jgi:hypothetical protein
MAKKTETTKSVEKVAKAAPEKAPVATKAKKSAAEAVAPETPKPAARRKAAAAAPANLAPLPSVGQRAAMRQVEERGGELPLEYGETKIVLLTRDPEWIFAYWEINAETRKHFGLQRGNHRRSLAIRVHVLQSNGHQPPFDVPVNDYTSSWYVRVPRGGYRFRAELGTYGDNGTFTAIAGSNELELPRMEISDSTDVEFAEINDEIYHQIVQLSGGVRLKDRLGSDEFLRSLQQRVFESIAGGPMSSAGLSSASFLGPGSSGSLSSSSIWNASSFGLSSGALSSSLLGGSSLFSGGILPQAGGENVLPSSRERRSDFWLEVGVDVIVYGATEPDAKVTFMGQEIRLTPDGTFRVRMVLPDTSIEFPVDAVSADGGHRRAVMPIVKRTTEGDPRKPL